MNSLLAQTEVAYSFDTGILVVAGIIAVLCGGTVAIRRRRLMATITWGVLSLLLAAFIAMSRRYDPNFVGFSVSLLIICFGCFVVSGVSQLGRRLRREV